MLARYVSLESIIKLIKKRDNCEELFIDISTLNENEINELKQFLLINKYYFKIIENGYKEKILYINFMKNG